MGKIPFMRSGRHRDQLESDNEAYLVTINRDAIVPMECIDPNILRQFLQIYRRFAQKNEHQTEQNREGFGERETQCVDTRKKPMTEKR
jgi:hypothetical protein